MNTLLVSYDLNRPVQNYDTLLERLRSYPTHWHNLDSFWLVKTNESEVQLCEALVPLIDDNDEVLVINVTGDLWASVGFSDKATKWLKDHF